VFTSYAPGFYIWCARMFGQWPGRHDGDRINALLAAAGHNMRLILRKLRLLFAQILADVLGPFAKQDTWPRLPAIQISIA
jgi:hypothetical protein